MDERELAFRAEILRIAEFFKEISECEFSDTTPSALHAQLVEIDRALTLALQVLIPRRMTHIAGQDLADLPFNWPVVQALQSGRSTLETLRVKGVPDESFQRPNYPTGLIAEMIELRDAARFEAKSIKPKRGNDARRTPASALTHELGKNFVLRFHSRFGAMPPMTKTGWIVDLMAEMLDAAGVSEADPAQVLRSSIEGDVMRGKLPVFTGLGTKAARVK